MLLIIRASAGRFSRASLGSARHRDDQQRQFARWLRANGAAVETDATGLPKGALEVSPLFGYDEDSFAASWAALASKPVVSDGLYLA